MELRNSGLQVQVAMEQISLEWESFVELRAGHPRKPDETLGQQAGVKTPVRTLPLPLGQG